MTPTIHVKVSEKAVSHIKDSPPPTGKYLACMSKGKVN